MRTRRLIPGLLLVALAGCDDATTLDQRRSFERCVAPQTPARMVMTVCTRLIDSGQLQRHNLAYAHYARSRVHLQAGNVGLALSDLDRAVELEPADVFLLVGRAVAKGSNGKLDGALEDLRHADQIKPNDPIVLGNLAIAMETVDPEQALVLADRAVKLDPDAPAIGQRCWMRAILKRDLEAALLDCDRALERAFEPGNTLNSRGLVYYRLGQFEKSIADYNRSEALLPAMASTRYVRGLAKRQLWDSAGADADIAKGIEMEPGIVQRFSGYGVE